MASVEWCDGGWEGGGGNLLLSYIFPYLPFLLNVPSLTTRFRGTYEPVHINLLYHYKLKCNSLILLFFFEMFKDESLFISLSTCFIHIFSTHIILQTFFKGITEIQNRYIQFIFLPGGIWHAWLQLFLNSKLHFQHH